MTIRAGVERLARPAMPVDAGEREGTSGRPPRSPVLRWSVLRWAGLVWLGAFLVLLANDPGRMFFETKLSVDLDPAGFYASLWHLMDPRNTFGALNNQAIGYAMPMGPFYLARPPRARPGLAHRTAVALADHRGRLRRAGQAGGSARHRVAGLPLAGRPGIRAVADVHHRDRVHLVSGAARDARPVGGAAADDGRARSLVRGGVVWAAARSGVVVLCMSGVNATVTIEALLLPGLFILTYARGRRLVSLAVCWGAAVAMATAWWALPLLLQGKYAFNFLPYVEQASTTTGTESAAAALRGAGNWTAYLNLGTPWLPAGWAMVSTPMAIIVGAIAAACGLYGLALRSMPAGTWLRLSVGPRGGLRAGRLRPARSAARFTGRSTTCWTARSPRSVTSTSWNRSSRPRWRWAWRTRSRPGWPGIPAGRPLVLHGLQRIYTLEARAVVGVVLIGLMLPYLSGQVLNPGSFSAVPRYWYQVAGFLAARSPHEHRPGGARGRARHLPVGRPDRRPAGGAGQITVGGARPGALRRRGVADPAGHRGKRDRIRRTGQRPGRLPAARRRPLRRGPERPGPAAGGLHVRGAGAPDAGAVRLHPGRLVRAADRR